MPASHFQIYTAEQHFIINTEKILLARTKSSSLCNIPLRSKLFSSVFLVHRPFRTYIEGEWWWYIRCGMEDGSFECSMEKTLYFSLHNSKPSNSDKKQNRKALASLQTLLFQPKRNRHMYDMDFVFVLACL